MTKTIELVVATAILILVAILIWYAVSILRRVTKNNVNADEGTELWNGKDYRCPECQTPMEQGYTLSGKGIIWAQRFGKKISAFAHIGQVLDNTLSLHMHRH